MIKKLLCYLFNKLWILLCKKESRDFTEAKDKIKEVQENILDEIIKENQEAIYGKKYKFQSLINIKSYQQQVPLSTFADYQIYIDKIAKGEKQVLTSEPILMLEPSSGTTAASKYIPYTSRLKDEFQRAIKPWLYNLYTNRASLFWGKSYWSITPMTNKQEKTVGGIPIGFEEDSEYFGKIERWILNFIFAVPKEIAKISNMANFRYITLLFLLKERELTLISVWNPTFLILLLEPIKDWQNRLLNDLLRGEINPPEQLDGTLKRLFSKKLGKNKSRSIELKKLFKEWDSDIYQQVWPNLKLISCWTDANANLYLAKLKSFFPKVEIQGKGLLATEGVISFPVIGEQGHLLAIRSHFFEFIEYPKADKIKFAWELEVGKIYSVVLTTGGGLYRYKLQDLVKVIGFTGQIPRIIFVGKEEKIVDYFGEKLNEYYVQEVLNKLLAKYDIKAKFYMLALENEKDNNFYTLFLEMELVVAKQLEKLILELDNRLRNNYHYDYCRKLGQLKEIRIFIIEEHGVQTYLQLREQAGQKLGDIKPAVLDNKRNWSQRFNGYFLKRREN